MWRPQFEATVVNTDTGIHHYYSCPHGHYIWAGPINMWLNYISRGAQKEENGDANPATGGGWLSQPLERIVRGSASPTHLARAILKTPLSTAQPLPSSSSSIEWVSEWVSGSKINVNVRWTRFLVTRGGDQRTCKQGGQMRWETLVGKWATQEE